MAVKIKNFIKKISRQTRILCEKLNVKLPSKHKNVIKNIVWSLYNSKKNEDKDLLNTFRDLNKNPFTLAGIVIAVLSQIRALKNVKKLKSEFKKAKKSSLGTREVLLAIKSLNIETSRLAFERYYSIIQQKFARSFNPMDELVKLRMAIKDAGSQKAYLEAHEPTRKRRIYHLSRTLFYLWRKVDNLHADIIRRNSATMLKIALFYGVSVVKFEVLSWSKHTPKRKSPYLAFW